ncbi:MAG TPA: hypothetical protein VMF13_16470 [Luteitalea sp.]|nr:hypothetical protein [Luteitalea sp.]
MVRFTVAVFDDVAWAPSLLQMLACADVRLQPCGGAVERHTPAGVLAELRCCRADVALWDLSPAISGYCQSLERLLDAHVFDGCGLVVSSTGSARVREYFGSRCAEMTIVDKPYTASTLLEALTHAAVRSHPRVHRAPRWSATGREHRER